MTKTFVVRMWVQTYDWEAFNGGAWVWMVDHEFKTSSMEEAWRMFWVGVGEFDRWKERDGQIDVEEKSMRIDFENTGSGATSVTFSVEETKS
jgi:hypothetical protein